jgi:hypothetical protein
VSKICAFFKTPLNQAALAGMLGTAVAVLQGQLSWQAALPMAVGAIVALVLPDDSMAKADIEQLVADAIKAANDLKGAK